MTVKSFWLAKETILSDKETFVNWRSNDFLAEGNISATFSALPWVSGGPTRGGSEFRKWEPQSLDSLESAKELKIVTEKEALLEDAVPAKSLDSAGGLTVSREELNQANQDSFEKGYAHGFEKAERKWESARETFLEVTQGMYREQKQVTTFFEPLKRLSLHIAQELVRGELSISSDAIERLIRGALEEIEEKGPAAIAMELNPQDLHMICSNLSQDLAHLDFRQNDSLSPGSVLLKLHNGAVEDLLEHRLEVLSEALFATISGDEDNKLNIQKDGDEEPLNGLKTTIDPEKFLDEPKDV